MNPSIYSIVSTCITFVVLMIYYMNVKPDFVLDKNEDKNKLSLRLCIVYSLLFSSAVGLLILGICAILQKYSNSE